MPGKTIPEPTRSVRSCPVRVISWSVLAQGQPETNLGQHRLLAALFGVAVMMPCAHERVQQ